MKISGNDLQSIKIVVPTKPTFRQNYNNHISELQNEVKFLKSYTSETPESEMLRSQSLEIKKMQIESLVQAFTL